MNTKMWSRRVPAQFVAVVALSVLGFAALAMSSAGVDDAGASVGSAPRPAPAPSAESRTPYGEMNLAWSEPGMIGVVGWAKDPDADRPIDVVVAIDNGGGMFVRTAGVYNPYLPGSYSQKFRSYLVAIPTSPGPHTMCVAALNVGRGNPFRLLGCKSFVIEPADPVGTLESIAVGAGGDTVKVGGWALDRENPFPLPVTVTVDGTAAGRLVASLDRPDIAAAFPGSGPGHGFSGDVPISPGNHRVCVVAQNLGRGADSTIGCRDLVVPRTDPLGNFELIVPATGGIDVSGWAADPNGAPIDVTISDEVVGGVDDQTSVRVSASTSRPDVAAATGLDPRAGFRVTMPALVPGEHRFCIVAHNVGMGRDVSLGCKPWTVGDARPMARIESVTPTASGARLVGWVFDYPEGPKSFRLSVDGVVSNRVTSISRPDVTEVPQGRTESMGFDITLTGLAAGRHSLCLVAPDPTPQAGAVNGDRVLPCASVVVGATALGTSGEAGRPIPVGPGGTLARIDRDAGVSVTLRDGSVLWLFGDSTEFRPDGSLKYFVGGTGAWASADQPAVTRDAVTPSGAPYLLATPGAGYPSCSPSRPNRVMWPLSAVAVPDGGRDRVVAFFANMCLNTENDYEFVGVSLAQWFYDPLAPPVGQPVQMTVINQDLDVARAWGTASHYDAVSGFAYLYQCDRPTNPFDIGGYGPCRVARVDPARIGEPAFYTYFNGGSWVAGENSAQPITMPAGEVSTTRYPASAFTVTFDPRHGVYVMVYSPWPGFVDRAMVRVSRTPQGPWTPPVEVAFAGCSNTVRGAAKNCYAATAQPAFSTSTSLGLGYYDQAIAGDRGRGQYVAVRVPFVVSLT